MSVLGIPAYP